jgi:hypothetical protein
MPRIHIVISFVYCASGFDSFLQKKTPGPAGGELHEGVETLSRIFFETAFQPFDDKPGRFHT